MQSSTATRGSSQIEFSCPLNLESKQRGVLGPTTASTQLGEAQREISDSHWDGRDAETQFFWHLHRRPPALSKQPEEAGDSGELEPSGA